MLARALLLLLLLVGAASVARRPPKLEPPPGCSEVTTDSGIAHTCCPSGESWQCFPAFIVAGTQKSGSTAILGLMAQHPSIVLTKDGPRGAKKEIHYFDKRWALKAAPPQTYLDMLPSVRDPTKLVTGEATPAYIVRENFCGQATTLMPNVRLIVLLRDPVDRAYSELQMKDRRVDELAELKAMLGQYAVEVRACLMKAESATGFTACLPLELRENTRIAAFAGNMVAPRKRRRNGGGEPSREAVSDRAAITARSCYPEPSRDFNPQCLGAVPQLGETARDPVQLIVSERQVLDRALRAIPGDTPMHQKLDALAHSWPNPGGGLQRGILFRGMYAPQIHQCRKRLADPKSLLVVESGALRNRPQETMDLVFAHVGLPSVPVDGSQEHLNSAISDMYPTFERTGWKLDGDYEPMPRHIRDMLVDFYRPHNKLLYSYLGEDFGWQ